MFYSFKIFFSTCDKFFDFILKFVLISQVFQLPLTAFTHREYILFSFAHQVRQKVVQVDKIPFNDLNDDHVGFECVDPGPGRGTLVIAVSDIYGFVEVILKKRIQQFPKGIVINQ